MIHFLHYLFLSVILCIPQEINCICKSFRVCLYQLHICYKILLGLSNLQIDFKPILIFHYYRNGNSSIKKIDKKTVVTNLRQTRPTMTNHNLDKIN